MHVGIANPRWWGQRSRHSRCMRNLQFYVSGNRPIAVTFGSYNLTSNLTMSVYVISKWLYQRTIQQTRLSSVLDTSTTSQWRRNGRDGVSNHRRPVCLLNRLFKRRSKKTSKLRVIGLCEGNSPVTSDFPALRASNAENAPIWWRHHEKTVLPPDTPELYAPGQ